MSEAYLELPGSGLTVDRYGIVRITQQFIIPGPRSDGQNEPYDVVRNWAPTGKPLGLPLVERRAGKEDNGDWLLSLEYEGATDDGALDPVLEIDESSVEEPLEAHEKFELIREKYKAIIDEESGNLKGWQPKLKSGGGPLVNNPMRGVHTYFGGNTIVRVTFGSRDFRGELFKNLRKIDPNPLVPEGTAGNVQTLLREGQSFLKKSLRGSFRGNIWLFTIEYWAGKWAPDIYEATE